MWLFKKLVENIFGSCVFHPNRKLLIEKLKFDAESVFGHPYGLFEVTSGQATPVCASQLVQDEGVGDIELRDVNGSGSADSSESTVPEEFNIELNPAQALQKLSQEEVLALKGQGITAGELVSKLVEGSASFSTRTEYSKSKYIRRKTKKHSDRVLILKPTVRLLARSYYMKDCVRVSNLRTDQLGMILQLAAVHHGRNVLVFDQVLGLVSAGVIERLGGQGACIHLHRGLIAQSIPCVHSMNFDEKIFSTFLPVRISSILGTKNAKEEENEEKEEVTHDHEAEDSSAIRRADRLAREQRGLALLAEGVDVLIIATRTVDPVSILEVTFPKLRPSGSVVVYGPHMEVCRFS
ncbi:eukaryotic initiation factor 3, gamma subunit [Cooperia oncophora]